MDEKDNTSGNLEAIINSIKYDQQVQQWFTRFLLSLNNSESYAEDNNFNENLKKLKKYLFFCNIIIIAFLILIIFGLLGKCLLSIGLAIFCFLYYEKLNYKSRLVTAELASKVIKNDFSLDELNNKSLYQISEIYSKKYKIPSLVDSIYLLDNTKRKTMLITVFCSIFMFSFKIWQIILTIVAINLLINIAASIKRQNKYCNNN